MTTRPYDRLINVFYIPLIEEPSLIRRFGEDYLLYRKTVPRWMPRRRRINPFTR